MPLRPVRVATVHRRARVATATPVRSVYGAGQHTYRTAKPAPTIASVPAEMTPAIAGEEAPPAPEVRETSGLLLPTPSGN